MELRGLHHLTAVTGNPSINVGFYTEVLGLRLVKKTVNQDDVSAYHLFYADGMGHPGTEVTFFDWPFAGRTERGAGTITTGGTLVNAAEALLKQHSVKVDKRMIHITEPIKNTGEYEVPIKLYLRRREHDEPQSSPHRLTALRVWSVRR